MKQFEVTFQRLQTYKTTVSTPNEELVSCVNLTQRLADGRALLVEQTDPEILTINEVKE